MTTAIATESIAVMLPIGVLRESKLNTRHSYDEKKMEELADSIARLGVLTPLLVRPNGDAYEIAAGHRRYRAAKKAGVEELPARVREMSDAEFLEVLMIENLQREDVHELDEANGYQQLMKSAGYDVATLAEKVGKSEAYIYARLKLCELLPEIQQKFYEGEITAGHAILLARLTRQGQIDTVKSGLYRESWDHGSQKHVRDIVGVRALGAWIQTNIHMELAKACFSPKDPDLVSTAGSCELCPKRSGFNPQLFPELKKKDHCTDRLCFNRKVDAFIKQKVDSGEMVALTDNYSNKDLPKWYDARIAGGAGAKKCDYAVIGICVDGEDKGQTRKVCVDEGCAVHYPKGSGSSSSRYSSAAQQKADKQRRQAAVAERTFRARVYDEICETVSEQLQKKTFRLAGAPLVAIADAIFDRLDYRDRKQVLEDLAIKQRSDDYRNAGLLKHFASMPAEQMTAVLVKLVARRHLQVSEYSGDHAQTRKELIGIAEFYKVDHDGIRAELSAARKTKKTKSQTSAKPKLKGKKK